MHVRRGDACINPDRRCHDYDEYEAGAGRIQRAYGLHRLYVLSDADDLPLARWGRRFTVEHQTAMNRSRYTQKPRGCERRGADGSCDFGVQPSTFPESRVRRGELGHAPVAELLRDLRHALRCRAFVGTLSAGVSKIVFALQLIAHAQVPPFVSLGRLHLPGVVSRLQGNVRQVHERGHERAAGGRAGRVGAARAAVARAEYGGILRRHRRRRQGKLRGRPQWLIRVRRLRSSHRLEPIGRRLSVALPALRAL